MNNQNSEELVNTFEFCSKEFKSFKEDMLCQQQNLMDFSSGNPVGFIIFYVAAILIVAGFFHLSKININNKEDNKKK